MIRGGPSRWPPALFWGGVAVLTIAILYLLSLVLAAGVDAREAKGAQRPPSSRAQSVVTQGYAVDNFHEPPMRILRVLGGKERVTLSDLLSITPQEYRKDAPIRPPIEVPVEVLKLVNPGARQSILGVRVGNTAYTTARRIPRNTLYYHNSRIACAAFVSAMFRKHKVSGYSFAVNTMYKQMRSAKNRSGRGGGRIVASRVSTRYTPYYKYFKAGDILYFHRGSRLGHVEVYVGRGLTAGTSSSRGRVAVRPVGNRGFSLMTVVRV